MNADFISVTIEQLPEGHLRAQQCPSKKLDSKSRQACKISCEFSSEEGRFPPSHPTLECGRRRGHFLGHLCCAAHYVRYKPQGHISIALGIHAGSHLGKCGLAAQKRGNELFGTHPKFVCYIMRRTLYPTHVQSKPFGNVQQIGDR